MNAHVVVQGKVVTTHNVRPGVAVLAHMRLTALLDVFAQRPTGRYCLVKAYWRKERTEEELRLRVAFEIDEAGPGRRLFDHFIETVMVQQVGNSHFTVLDAVAEGQISRNGHTDGWVRKG